MLLARPLFFQSSQSLLGGSNGPVVAGLVNFGLGSYGEDREQTPIHPAIQRAAPAPAAPRSQLPEARPFLPHDGTLMRTPEARSAYLELLNHMSDRDALFGVVDGSFFVAGYRVPLDLPRSGS
jgi:hypothetical protein